MIEIIDPNLLSLISGFFVVIIVVMFAWKSRFFHKQLDFAKALPEEITNKGFLVAVLFNSLPVVVDYFKWLIKYFITIGWFLLIFIIISTNIQDFEFSILIILAIVTAKVTTSGKAKSLKGEQVIILSPEEHERILKGKAKIDDFRPEK